MNRYEKHQKQAGFTIIEVLIVLAVSAMLATSIMIWQGSINDRARLSEAIDKLTAQLMENRTWVLSTVNVSSGGDTCGGVSVDPGSNPRCVVFARVVRFNAGSDRVDVHVVAARRDITSDEILFLTEITDLSSEFTTKWGLQFEGALRGGQPVDAIAFTRNYTTGELETYTLNQGSSLTDLDSYSSRDPAVFTFVDPTGNRAFINVNESANSIRRSFP